MFLHDGNVCHLNSVYFAFLLNFLRETLQVKVMCEQLLYKSVYTHSCLALHPCFWLYGARWFLQCSATPKHVSCTQQSMWALPLLKINASNWEAHYMLQSRTSFSAYVTSFATQANSSRLFVAICSRLLVTIVQCFIHS